MNCLDRVILQEYVDNELNSRLRSRIDAHLQECEKCRDLLEEVRSGREHFLEFLSLMKVEKHISIPDPAIKGGSPQAWLMVAAGLAFIIGLFLITQNRFLSRTQQLNEAELLYLEILGDVEPNKSWHNGQSLIVLSSEKGKVILSYSNED